LFSISRHRKLIILSDEINQQDALRKARPSSQQPGAWAGTIIHIVALLGVCILTSVEKWAKMKAILEKWWKQLAGADGLKLLHKELL
jgi:hypothetical protein